MKKILYLIFIISLLFTNLNSKIKISYNKKKGKVVKSSTCPANDGKNSLKPVPIEYLKPAQSKVIFKELVGGDTKFQKNKWTFKKGKALNGKLSVDFYVSKFKAAHISGGMISVRYLKGKGDPKSLRWIQMINTSYPLNNAKPPYIDPFPNDDKNFKAGTSLPFYYTNGEIKTRVNGKNKYGKFDLKFHDFSTRDHLPDSNVKWTADLYISSWDKKKNTVTIHDGIRWGWIAGCKKKKKEKKPQTAVPAPKGSRLVVPKIVIAGKPATISVIGTKNNLLEGVVVDCAGEEYFTNKSGKVTFIVPENTTVVPVEIVSLSLKSSEPITVIKTSTLPEQFFKPGTVPVVDSCPGYIGVSEEISIGGGPFFGKIGENRVKLGEKNLPVLAGSPAELIARIPNTIPIGENQPVTVTTPAGTSKPVNVRCIRFRLEADMTRLFKGQGTKGRLIIEGTKNRVMVEIKNLTPGIISMKGGNVIRKKTSGGRKNGIRISFKGIHKGRFHITGRILDKVIIKK